MRKTGKKKFVKPVMNDKVARNTTLALLHWQALTRARAYELEMAGVLSTSGADALHRIADQITE